MQLHISFGDGIRVNNIVLMTLILVDKKILSNPRSVHGSINNYMSNVDILWS